MLYYPDQNTCLGCYMHNISASNLLFEVVRKINILILSLFPPPPGVTCTIHFNLNYKPNPLFNQWADCPCLENISYQLTLCCLYASSTDPEYLNFQQYQTQRLSYQETRFTLIKTLIH